MSDPLDIAQAHLRAVLVRALGRRERAEQAAFQARHDVEIAQDNLTLFLHNKYPKEVNDRE